MQDAKDSLLAKARLLFDLIEAGKHNPFERVDAQILERIHRDLIKTRPASYEESPF